MMDPKMIARSVADFFGTGLERATESRRNPAIDRHFLDVDYRDTIAIRWEYCVVSTITFGFEYTREFEEARAGARRCAAPNRSRPHNYDPTSSA